MKMNFKYAKSSLALALGLSLAGCQTVTPLAVLGPSLPTNNNAPGAATQAAAPVAQPIPEITPIGMSEMPKVELASTVAQNVADGQLKFAIRWPERAARSVQIIPTSANSLRVRIYRASDNVELANELFDRPAAPQQYWDHTLNRWVTPPNVISKSYSLTKDVAYKVEVMVYAEAKASVTAGSTAIAFTATPADVTLSANQTQSLSLTLSALYTPVVTPASYAIGSGASLTINGSGFGTDSSLIKLLYKTSNSDSGTNFSSNIATVSNNVISFTLPNSFSGSGNLYVSRDGVDATSSISLTAIQNLSLSNAGFKQASLNVSPWTNFNIGVAGATYSIVPTATAWVGGSYTQLDNATYSVQVFDKTSGSTDITSTAVNGSVVTLPSGKKKYQIKVASGNVNNTLDVQGAIVGNWPASVATVSVSPYYLPNYGLAADGLTNITSTVDLGSAQLQAPDVNANLTSADIDWTFGADGTGNVMVDTNPQDGITGNKVAFKASSNVTGTVPITGRLKGAPSNSFQFNANVVKINAIGLQESLNWGPWSDSAATASLAVNSNLRLRIGAYTLSDGLVVSLSDQDRQKLSPWSGSTVQWGFLNNGTNAYVTKSDGYYTETTVTGKATGTPTVRVRYQNEANVFGTIVITVP